MAVVRVCLVLVFVLCINTVAAKPFLWDDFLCDLICDDEDIREDTASTPRPNDYDWFSCAGCPTARPPRTTVVPGVTTPMPVVMPMDNGGMQGLRFIVGPGQLMNITRVGTDWVIQTGSGSGSGSQTTTTTTSSQTTAATSAGPTAATTAAG